MSLCNSQAAWDLEQRLQQEYFDSIDRVDVVQQELWEEESKLTKNIKSVSVIENEKKSFVIEAEHCPLTERQRQINLARWTLRSLLKST